MKAAALPRHRLRRRAGDLRELSDFGCDDTGCSVDGDPEARLREDPSGEFASVEPAELRRFLQRPGQFTFELAEVNSSGSVRNLSVQRGELLRSTNLRPRDLRAVAFRALPGSDMGPVLAARRGTLLLGLGDVRAIVEPQRALLFAPSSTDSVRFLRVLGNQRQASPESSFRMLCVESALLALSRKLSSRLLEVRRATEPKLVAPPVLLEPDLEEVRQQRRVLVRTASQASAVSSALLSRLDGDELVPNAAGVGGEGSNSDAAVEWETMLEVYLQTYSELSRECNGLLSDIEDFEGSVNLMLQARRLRVEQFELSLVIGSLSVGAAGLLPGSMGMNLLSGYESKEGAFTSAALATISICVTLFVVLRWLAASRGFLN